MEIPPLDPRVRSLHAPPVEARRSRPEAQVDAPADDNKTEEASAPAEPSVEVVVQDRASGLRTVTIFDIRTGLPVYEAPPEALVHQIERTLWQIRNRYREEETSHGDHRR